MGFLIFLIGLGAEQIIDPSLKIKIEAIRAKTRMFHGWESILVWIFAQFEILFAVMLSGTGIGWLMTVLIIPFFIVLGYLFMPTIIRVLSVFINFIGRILAGTASNPWTGAVVSAVLIIITAGVIYSILSPVMKYVFATPPVEYCPGATYPEIRFEKGSHVVKEGESVRDVLIVKNVNPPTCNATIYEVRAEHDARVIQEGKVGPILTFNMTPGDERRIPTEIRTGWLGILIPALPPGIYEWKFWATDLSSGLKSEAILRFSIIRV